MESKKFCPYCMSPIEEGLPCSVCGLTEGAYTPAPHHLPLGTVLVERYLVGRVLGEGGFGITYIGCDLRLEMKVAIKEYFPVERVTRTASVSLDVNNFTGGNYQRYKDKFLREARAMARMVKLPEIVGVRDYFEANNTAYIVMEYVEGTTMRALVEQRGGGIPAEELLSMMKPLFLALGKMHKAGLIHRDISPENLMLENGSIRLLDFGCARESTTRNETMTITLKYGYAPVEQYQQNGQGPWTDVYALAATIYFCLTGQRPPQAMDRVVEDEVVPPRKLGVALTEQQEKALLHAMGIRPTRRFKSMEEFYAALYEGKDWTVMVEPEDEEQPEEIESNSQTDTENSKTGTVHVARTVTRSQKSSGETPAEPAWKRWLRGHRVALGAGLAAIVAVILIAVSLNGMRGRSGEADSEAADTEVRQDGEEADNEAGEAAAVETDDAAAGEAAAEETAEETDASEREAEARRAELNALFENAVTYSDDSGEEFAALLSDDSVSAVVLSADTGVNIWEDVTITKPVLVEVGAFLGAQQALTVSGENAVLYVKGECGAGSVMRTENGGCIITDGGNADQALLNPTGSLWLENESDYEAIDGEMEWGSGQLLVYSLNDAFAQTTEVSTTEEFEAANQEGAAGAIVITGDVTVDAGGASNYTIWVPLWIREGASFTVTGTADNGDNVTCADDAALVNQGTLNANVNTGSSVVLNYGTWTGGFWDGNALLINYGELNETSGNCQINDVGDDSADTFGQLYNHGVLNVYGDSGQEESSLYLAGGVFFNCGAVTVGGGSTSANLSFSNSVTAKNIGEISVREGGNLQNSGLLYSLGSITVDGGSLNNSGVLYGYNLVQNSGEIVNDGVILSENGSAPQLLSEPGGIVEDVRSDGGEGWAVVTSADELQAALDDSAVQSVYLSVGGSWSEFSGDLTVNKPLYVRSGLRVDGTLTVSSGYVVVGMDGKLSAQELVLEKDTQLVQLNILGADTVRLGEGAALYSVPCTFWTNGVQMTSLCNIEIGADALLLDCSKTLALDGGNITVRTGGTLRSCGELNLLGCTVEIEPQGFLDLNACWRFDENTTVTNNGWLRSEGINMYRTELAGTLTSNGAVYACMTITGVVENNGTFYAIYNGSDSETVTVSEGGELRGNALIQLDGWVEVDWRN